MLESGSLVENICNTVDEAITKAIGRNELNDEMKKELMAKKETIMFE